MLGLGYVGLPTAALLASRGHQVTGVDVNPDIVTRINNGQIHIVEPELDILVKTAVESGRLSAALQPTPADIFIICVPTPVNADTHSSDLTFVQKATGSIIPVLQPGNAVLLESTSPPGTTENVIAAAVTKAGFIPGQTVFVAYCPERVLPGAVITELVTNERTVGGLTPACASHVARFYKSFVQADIHETTARVAETVKLVENTSRDYQIAFANELSLVCREIGVNVWDVIELANRHPRVNVLQPGPGVGGHCIAVDPWFLIEAAPEQARLIKSARQFNDSVPHKVAQQIAESANAEDAKTIALLGMAYKSNIDDCRESPSIEIYNDVKKLCPDKKVVACEPNVQTLQNIELYTLDRCLREAELLVILVAHTEFLNLDWKQLQNTRQVLDYKGISQP